MKRFTLTRGTEVLAEGVVWTDGTATARESQRVIKEPSFWLSVEQLLMRFPPSVVVNWIDETHEAKRELPVIGTATDAARTEHVTPVTSRDLVTDEYLREQVTQGLPRGQLPSERIEEIRHAIQRSGSSSDFMTQYVTALAMWLDEHHAGKEPAGLGAYLPKRAAGKLPSERAREIFASQGIPPWNAGEILEEHQTIWRVLDEFIGKKAL